MKMKKSRILILLLSLSFITCSKEGDDEYVVREKTIFDHVSTSMNYSYLTYALQKTELDVVLSGEDDYTLYAPNNSAFIGYLMRNGFRSIDEVPTAALKQLLLNHVMIGQIQYRDFESGYYNTAASSAVNDQPMSIYINQVNMRVTLNGNSRIVQGNVRASNGIIHAVL